MQILATVPFGLVPPIKMEKYGVIKYKHPVNNRWHVIHAYRLSILLSLMICDMPAYIEVSHICHNSLCINPHGLLTKDKFVQLPICVSGIHKLNNPVSVAPRYYWYVADRDWIELPRLSVDRSQFGRAGITVDFTHIFAIIQLLQLYFIPISCL